ncbi:MAG: glycine dehydrogenase (aminomethyl-transferring), partial [Gemmatimonadetes bacterium]|nr:glycine dehydrogenase (aminomethyl-transferring) [Gemmatimonadota bacterium]
MTSSSLPQPDVFAPRHLGPSDSDVQAMLKVLGYPSLDALIDATVPPNIRFGRALNLPAGLPEQDALADFKALVAPNQVWRSFIGQGYYGTHMPAVIQRNILENPGWYTAYTPYQAEIAQGRLEALLNFQTTVIDLTGLPLASASLLDEATAAAEAMQMLHAAANKRDVFIVADDCHPQTIDVVKARGEARGITVVVRPVAKLELDATVCGVLIQYPNTFGEVSDYRALCEQVHAAGALVVAATDLLALTVLTPPGEWGADVAVGNAQRFGVPYGYGGPHAAFLTTKEEFKRLMPGRIIGVSRDTHGKPAMRMALGTREQHIRREKATSNICTAQVLLAVLSGMYAVFHGPEGLKRIAQRLHHRAETFAAGVRALGHTVRHDAFLDTVCVTPKGGVAAVRKAAEAKQVNLRYFADGSVGVSMGETTTVADLGDLLAIFGGSADGVAKAAAGVDARFDERFARTSAFLTHPVFHQHRSETDFQRYVRSLEAKDLSLVHSMISLGSCTMKLNAAAEMLPITWPEIANIHPFAPVAQTAGYQALFIKLEAALAEITGFHAVSLQPNAGSQGEYTGLLVIRAYHRSRGDAHRNICLIPQSAHGT